MKKIPLRTLVREPLKVKRLIRAGQSITVTDHGDPLWIIQSADGESSPDAEANRRKAIDEVLEEVLGETPVKISAAQLLEASRR